MRTKRYKRVVCNDGFSMSVQAHSTAYCTPRGNFADEYTAVEVGFPNNREELLKPYAEDWDKPTNTVYGYVPVQTVYLIITKHQGMSEGELPVGVPNPWTSQE